MLKISSSKPAGALAADVDAVVAGDFLGQVMGGFAVVVAVGAGAFDGPVEAGGPGFLLQDAFRQRAAADVAEADHEKSRRLFGRRPIMSRAGRRFLHGRKSTELLDEPPLAAPFVKHQCRTFGQPPPAVNVLSKP
jgi:hypothetical protein